MEGALDALRQEILRHRAAFLHGYSKWLCVCVGMLSSLLLTNEIDTQEGGTAWQGQDRTGPQQGFYHAQKQRHRILETLMNLTNL